VSEFCRELWRPVIGFEDRYMVSNTGRVLSRGFWSRFGNQKKWNRPRLRKLSTDVCGRKFLNIKKSGKVFMRRVHILVAEAFIGERPKGMFCCHNDGNPNNNNVNNLRWDTAKSNQLDRNAHGTSNKNENNPMAKLKLGEVSLIKKLLKNNYKQGIISKMFFVSPCCIKSIRRNLTWGNVA